jgi:hypothetical protein
LLKWGITQNRRILPFRKGGGFSVEIIQASSGRIPIFTVKKLTPKIEISLVFSGETWGKPGRFSFNFYRENGNAPASSN